jgi:hypothetical protein
MALTVTPSRRRIAMAAMLSLAAGGAVIRHFAPDPSTLHDIGTLLLVLWLPAVGNLIAYFAGKIPRGAPRVTEFIAGSAFTPHLQVDLTGTGLPTELLEALDPAARACTLIVRRHGYTARLAQPVADTLATPGQQTLALELLHPAVGLAKLKAGTDFHLLVATTAVAKGRVMAPQAV